jgi:hypothetical protein
MNKPEDGNDSLVFPVGCQKMHWHRFSEYDSYASLAIHRLILKLRVAIMTNVIWYNAFYFNAKSFLPVYMSYLEKIVSGIIYFTHIRSY